MPRRLQLFGLEELKTLHQATVDILESCGVEFPSEKTRRVFQDHGYRVEQNTVFITADQLDKALSTAPSHLTVQARNPENNLRIGGDDFVVGLIGGSVNTVDEKGRFIPGTLKFYEDFCRLVQTSDILTPAPHGCCYPSDVPPETAYLDMLLRDLTLTDRAMKGNNGDEHKAAHSLEMAALIFGGLAAIEKDPASLNCVNIRTPLTYAYDQSEALMVFARHNQPVAVANMMMLGTTAPVSLPGALVLSNAEVLAGVVLTQLVRPGTGIIYGSTNCPTDMKSLVATVGSPETFIMSRGAIALADFYGLPCRTGGGMTDSHLPDAQAMIDSTLGLAGALAEGAHWIHQGMGMLSSYLTASLEKLVLDEEMVRMVVASLKLPAITSDTLGLDLIKKLGCHGNYITRPETLKGFRKIFRSKFLNRLNNGPWLANGGPSAFDAARAEVARRLKSYQKPPLDPKLEAALTGYVAAHKR